MSAQLGLFQTAGRCRFYLGTHEEGWLRTWTDGPLFVSRRRLARRKSLPRAAGPWAMDSGGFTEITTYGRWTVTPRDYADEVVRYRDEIGGMEWAATQDWMCEDVALAKTGKSIEEHQRLSVRSYLDLREIAPEVPWVPVLQGFSRDDYLRCADMYEAEGVDLAALPTVGVGSVCRRQGTLDAIPIFVALHGRGIRLHGFGLKLDGLRNVSHLLASSDSMAWSAAAAWRPIRLDGCSHKTCANCPRWAALWRREVLDVPGVCG
jgi:hypothetical protein